MGAFDFDIAAVIAASVAAIVSLIAAYDARKDNAKKDMLENLTKERINDVHNIRKWSGVILSEASLALKTKAQQKDERLSNIIQATNELWYLFKPVYELDRQVLYALKKLVEALYAFYDSEQDTDMTALKEAITLSAREFREKSFLYSHSAWTCVKNQILEGERSSYNEFGDVHAKNSAALQKLHEKAEFAGPHKDIWNI